MAPGSVGVGVMAYWGTSADGRKGRTFHDNYVVAMKEFVRWLLDEGHSVRILIGDHADEPEAREILADAEQHWNKVGQPPIDFVPVASTSDVMQVITSVETVSRRTLPQRAHGSGVRTADPGHRLWREASRPDGANELRPLLSQYSRDRSQPSTGTVPITSRDLGPAIVDADGSSGNCQRQRVDHQFSELFQTLLPSAQPWSPWADLRLPWPSEGIRPASLCARRRWPAHAVHNDAAVPDGGEKRSFAHPENRGIFP